VPEVAPSVVFFDLDNTLYGYGKAHEAALAKSASKAFALLGLKESNFLDALNVAKKNVKQRLGNTAASHSRLLYFKEAIELSGLGPQPLAALELEQCYWSTFLASMVMFDQAFDFLEDLRISRIPMILVTDLTTQIQLRKIAYLGLEKYFDVIVTSEEAGAEKPEAAPFELANERFGALDGVVWFIGDNPEKDTLGARKHLNAVTFQRVDSSNPAGIEELQPDFSFESFAEVRALFSKVKSN
jgi:putative hydrolase of the HAD superfamily